METFRGNPSTDKSLYSGVLCRNGKWHAICFSIVSRGATGGDQQQNFQRRRRAMKTNLVRMAVLVLAAVTMALPAFAGQTQAERERARRPGADPESVLGWQIRPALGTGSVPAGNATESKPEGVAKGRVPTVVIGGTVYRIGIDTP
jgi:hypothetical protein